jgi:hypothetical protein
VFLVGIIRGKAIIKKFLEGHGVDVDNYAEVLTFHQPQLATDLQRALLNIRTVVTFILFTVKRQSYPWA